MTQNYWVIAKAQLLLFQSWKYLPCYFLSHFPSLPLCPYRWWSKDTSGPKSVYRDFFFPSSASWPSKTNMQIPIFQTWRRAPAPESLSDFSSHTHWPSKRSCFLLQSLSQQIVKKTGKIWEVQQLYYIFSTFLSVLCSKYQYLWQNDIWMYSYQLCSCWLWLLTFLITKCAQLSFGHKKCQGCVILFIFL